MAFEHLKIKLQKAVKRKSLYNQNNEMYLEENRDKLLFFWHLWLGPENCDKSFNFYHKIVCDSKGEKILNPQRWQNSSILNNSKFLKFT